MRRRALLASIGAAAVGAGCLGANPGGSPGTDERTPAETPYPSEGEPDVTPSVVDAGVETVETGCMSDEEPGIDVTFGDGAVTIDGTAQTPTPCYEATIAGTDVSTGELHVRLAFESTKDVCVECVGVLTYAATVEVDGSDGLDTVSVTHGEDGETFTVERGES